MVVLFNFAGLTRRCKDLNTGMDIALSLGWMCDCRFEL